MNYFGIRCSKIYILTLILFCYDAVFCRWHENIYIVTFENIRSWKPASETNNKVQLTINLTHQTKTGHLHKSPNLNMKEKNVKLICTLNYDHNHKLSEILLISAIIC